MTTANSASVAETVRQLHGAIAGKPDIETRRRDLADEIAALRQEREVALARPSAGPMTNSFVSRALSEQLDEDAIVFGELGLDQLEATDRLAELMALLRVFDRER